MIRLLKFISSSLFGLVFMMIVAAVTRVIFGLQFAASWDQLVGVAVFTTVAGVLAFAFYKILENEKEGKERSK